MIQIRITDDQVKPVLSVLANGVFELSIASTDSLELAINANQELIPGAVRNQLTNLFGSSVFPRTFEQTDNGVVIRPHYCKLINVCLGSEFPKP